MCNALDVPAVQGMIAAGHLTPEDVGVTVINRPHTVDTEDLSNSELLREIARRLEAATATSNAEHGESIDVDVDPEKVLETQTALANEEAASRAEEERKAWLKRNEGERLAARRRRSSP